MLRYAPDLVFDVRHNYLMLAVAYVLA